MRGWQNYIRFALALFVVGLGSAVFLNLRDRAEPVRAIVVERTDPDATIQTRGSRIIQTDSLGDNLMVLSERQLTYPDGTLRMIDGVEVTVKHREDREGFSLRGMQASVDGEQTEVTLVGSVQFLSENGLEATSESATYTERDGMVRMPQTASFEREGMTASAEGSEYSRQDDLLQLIGSANVTLLSEGMRTVISSNSATLAQTAGYMTFEGEVEITRAGRMMEAQRAHLLLSGGTSDLESLTLEGDARILDSDPESKHFQAMAAAEIRIDYGTDGQQIERVRLSDGARIDGAKESSGSFREMVADEIEIRYDAAGQQIESVSLVGGARILGGNTKPGQFREMKSIEIALRYDQVQDHIEQVTMNDNAQLALFGPGSKPGTEISSAWMEVNFDAQRGEVSKLSARNDVKLVIPKAGTKPLQRIMSNTFRATGESGAGLEDAEFEGSVEYQELTEGQHLTKDGRVARAQRLDAVLGKGLSALESAKFSGSVVFEDGDIQGRGDVVDYRILDDTIELSSPVTDGEFPRVIDARGSVEAHTIRLVFAGPQIQASGAVESVLSAMSEAKRPGLLSDEQPILVTADEFSYNGQTEIAIYRGAAHLWQGESEFRGEQIVLDESAGNLSIKGAASTRTILSQVDDKTGLLEDSNSIGSASAVHYYDKAHRVTYTRGATVAGPRGDLTGDVVHLFLQSDNKTLDRIVASGGAQLLRPGQLVSGDRLIYHDADGRYEMSGEPVRIIEEVEDEESEDEISSEALEDDVLLTLCRETTGRTLTFFLTADDVSVDGQAEVRTETASGECPELMPR
jgi:lipopolysaccharide export system protein LptA